MLVKDIMVRDVITVSPFTSLRDALRKMKEHKLKCLVVEKQGPHDAYGLVTYTNILKTIAAESGDIDLVNVYDVYNKPAISVGADLDVKHASALMTQHKLKRIIVVDNNELIGLLTMNDIVGNILSMIE